MWRGAAYGIMIQRIQDARAEQNVEVQVSTEWEDGEGEMGTMQGSMHDCMQYMCLLLCTHGRTYLGHARIIAVVDFAE